MVLSKDFFNAADFPFPSLLGKGPYAWSILLTLNDLIKQHSYRIEVEIPEGVHLENREWIAIGEGTVLEPGVFIRGPSVIGKNCKVRHGAYLREGSVLGDGCVVGHGTEVKHSVFFNGACAAHLCYVGDSVLGASVNLGAGVKCANLRLDKREISVIFEARKINTQLKKFGAAVGDGAQVGCNCVLNPGTLVGRETFIHPLLNVGGVIPAASEVKGAQGWVAAPRTAKILERLLT